MAKWLQGPSASSLLKLDRDARMKQLLIRGVFNNHMETREIDVMVDLILVRANGSPRMSRSPLNI